MQRVVPATRLSLGACIVGQSATGWLAWCGFVPADAGRIFLREALMIVGHTSAEASP